MLTPRVEYQDPLIFPQRCANHPLKVICKYARVHLSRISTAGCYFRSWSLEMLDIMRGAMLSVPCTVALSYRGQLGNCAY